MQQLKAQQKITSTLSKFLDSAEEENTRKKKLNYEWYSLRHMLGYANWAMFYVLLGGREAGKSYSVTDFFCRQFKTKGIPFVWIRLTEAASRKLLQNNAEKLVDPDLRRKYNLDLYTNGCNVYHVVRRSAPDRDGKTHVLEKRLFARVYNLSTFYNDKGSIFDKDFLNDPNMRYNIAIDEFEREKGEKNTFDITYSLVNQLENLVRSTKDRIKIFFLGNTLEEASDILCAFDFIPEEFGIYKLKSKRCVIEYIEPSEAYLQRRKGTIADILMPTASTFTNKVETDKTLISKEPLITPKCIIKFTKDRSHWYTIWNDNIIAKYNGEKKKVIAMRPYLDELFETERRDNIITLFDTRSFNFRNLITFKQFQADMELLKPRK
jgi:hypothetical protein